MGVAGLLSEGVVGMPEAALSRFKTRIATAFDARIKQQSRVHAKLVRLRIAVERVVLGLIADALELDALL